MVDKYWEQAKKEAGATTLTSTREAALEVREAIRDGRIVPEQMEPAMRRGVELGVSLLDRADELDEDENSQLSKEERNLPEEGWTEWTEEVHGVPVGKEFSGEQLSGPVLGQPNYVPGAGYFPSDESYPVFSEEELWTKRASVSQSLQGPVIKSALLNALNQGKSITQASLEALDAYTKQDDGDALFKAATTAAVEADVSELERSLDDIDLSMSPEDVEEQFEVTLEAVKKLREEGKNPDYVLLKMAANPDVREETIERLAIDHELKQLAAQTWDDMSKADVAWGFMRDFLLPISFYDNAKISGSVFAADRYLDKMITNFRSKPVEEQQRMMPAIKEWIDRDLPDLKKIGLYNAFASSDFDRDLTDFHAAWAALDAAEVALGAGLVVKGVIKLNQTRKIVKDMKDLGKADEVAEAASSATLANTDEAATLLGMDKKSLHNTMSPLATEHMDPNSIDGVSKAAYDKLAAAERRHRAWEERTISDQDILREGAFNSKQRARIEKEKVDKYLEEYSVQDAVVIDRRRDGFTLEFEGFDEDGVSLGRMTEDFAFTLDDASQWEVDSVGMFRKYILSPLALFKTDDVKDVARAAQRLDNIQSKMLNEMRVLYREALSPIVGNTGLRLLSRSSRKKVADVDYVLMKGDQEKAVYSVDELKSGILGVKLQDDQVEAYYKVRSLMDSLGRVRNDGMRREKLLRGERGVILGGKHLSAKPYNTVEQANASLVDSGRKFVYVEEKGDVSVDALKLGDHYKEGKALVRLPEPMDLQGYGNKVFYALVNADDITDLPQNLLNLRKGYIPKINQQAAYFVREYKAQKVDGVNILATDARAESRAIRAFATKAEADEFTAKMVAKAKADGKTVEELRYVRHEDRELEKTKAISSMGDEHQLGRPGGMFTGARAEELLWGMDGVEAPRLDSFTSISHYISNLSRYTSRNEWRLGMEASALKTANALEGQGNRVYKSFDQLGLANETTENGNIIKALHRQIEDWNNWPTADEVWFSYATQKIIDSSIGAKLGDKGRGILFNIKDKDPTAAMRAAAFHGLLGWFNPIQLWVQAQGSAVAMSMNILRPDKLALAIKDQTALSFLSGTRKTDEMIALSAKSLKLDGDRMVKLTRAWERSGLEDSVLATADHSAALNGRGVALDSISRAADHGLLFYRKGELFNRRFSFSTAFEEWHSVNKGAELTDDALRSIIDRSHDLMLNLSKGNRARWQRGILGTATQFQQVSAKTLETLFGMNGNFTKEERLKIMMGQAALYGGAGVPLGSMGTQWAAELLGYNSISDLEENMDPKTAKALNEGFVGWFTLTALGVDIDIGRRSALISQIEGVADDIMFGEGNIVANALGAFSGPAGNFWKGMSGTYAPFSLTIAQDRPLSVLNLATNPLIASLSTTRNIDKAIFMRQMEVILSNDMSPIAVGPFTWKEQLATAIGFNLSQVTDVYDLRKVNRHSDEYRASVVNNIVRFNYQAAMWSQDEEGFTDQRKEWLEQAISSQIQSVDGNWGQLQVIKAVQAKLRDSKKDPRAVEFQKWRQNQSDDPVRWLEALVSLEGKGIMIQDNK